MRTDSGRCVLLHATVRLIWPFPRTPSPRRAQRPGVSFTPPNALPTRRLPAAGQRANGSNSAQPSATCTRPSSTIKKSFAASAACQPRCGRRTARAPERSRRSYRPRTQPLTFATSSCTPRGASARDCADKSWGMASPSCVSMCGPPGGPFSSSRRPARRGAPRPPGYLRHRHS
jgi:hypothetical protein